MTVGSAALAAEPVPGDACSGANNFIVSAGPETSGKTYLMTCQSSVWVRIMETDTAGNLGVKQTLPKAPLHVGGEVIVGATTGLSCDANRKGALRWNNTSSKLEFCNGTAWGPLLADTACADTTPNVFTFTDQANVVVSTLTESNIVQITGMDCNVGVSISGGGSPAYRLCSTSNCSAVVQDWTTGGSVILPGQYMQLRLTSPSNGGGTFSAMVIAGNTTDSWSVATAGDCASSPPVGTVCADGTVYAGISVDGMAPMYVTRCDAGQTWDGTTCTGVRWQLTWNNNTGNWLTTNVTNSITGEANTTGLAGLSDIGAPYIAAEWCDDYDDGNGNTDWYLPGSQELGVIYAGKNAIGQFTANDSIYYYWSSLEYDSDEAYVVTFGNGTLSRQSKTSARSVRCARKD